jgi:hypothetical protein
MAGKTATITPLPIKTDFLALVTKSILESAGLELPFDVQV